MVFDLPSPPILYRLDLVFDKEIVKGFFLLLAILIVLILYKLFRRPILSGMLKKIKRQTVLKRLFA